MATTKISRTSTTGTPTSSTQCTISAWFKRGKLEEGRILTSYNTASSQSWIEINASHQCRIANYIGSYNMQLITTRLFRDPSAWYHFVVAFDTTQAIDTNRVKFYVNGVQETLFGTATYPAQHLVLKYAVSGQTFTVGAKDTDTYFDGDMSHVQFVDGLQLAPTEFGEVDATSGIWKIKTGAYATPGTNGFYLKMENRTNLDLDSSSNALTFTTSGTLTATYDNPANNFATWNPLAYNPNPPTYSHGNTDEDGQTNAQFGQTVSTLAFPKSAKWYAEFKKLSSDDKEAVGIADAPSAMEALRANTDIYVTGYGGQASIRANGTSITFGSEVSGYVSGGYVDNDIMQVAFDGDNGAVYFGKNGTWGNSGVPTSGASKTGAVDISGLAWYQAADDLLFLAGEVSPSGTGHLQANFGNGYFGTTVITSPEADDAGEGAFKYDVPAGFYALCTNNLATYG